MMSTPQKNLKNKIKNPILILKNNENEGPGLIKIFFEENNIDYEIKEFYQNDEELNLDSFSAYIILGGPMSANDDLPFINKEIKLIQEIIHRNIPFLGICLGSQLLAKSGGAFVKINGIKEIGVYNVFLTSMGIECPLFKDIKNPIKVFQWHGETFSIPPLGKWLATSETCKNQAVQLGNAFGLQFHLEFTPKMVKQIIDQNIHEFNNDKEIVDILNQFEKYYPEIKDLGYKLIQNFLKIINKPFNT